MQNKSKLNSWNSMSPHIQVSELPVQNLDTMLPHIFNQLQYLGRYRMFIKSKIPRFIIKSFFHASPHADGTKSHIR